MSRKNTSYIIIEQWSNHLHWQWILLLMLLALVLRLPNIGRDSLWFDEAISYLAATLPVSQIIDNSVQSSHPPLYYLFLHAWQAIVPNSDAALRGLGVLWNVLLIPLIIQFANDLFQQKRVALIAGLLVALSPFHLLYSHELRMYTQLMFFVTLGSWGYWRARTEAKWHWWALFAIGFGMAIFTHMFATLALAAVGVHSWLYRKQKQKAFWITAVIITLLTISYLPWLFSILAESQKELGSLRPLTATAIRNPIKPLTSLTFLLFGQSSQLIYSGFALFLTLAFVALLLLEIRRIRQEGVSSGFALLIIQIGFLLGIPVIVYLIRPFFLPERTMAAASPLLILLLAWTSSRQRTPFPYLVGIAAVVMIAGTSLYHSGEPLKPPYRDAMAFVAANATPEDVVLHSSDGSYLPALRYVALPNHAVLAGDPDPRKPVHVFEALGGEVWNFDKATSSNQRIWLIVALEHSVEWQQAQVAQIDAQLIEIERHEFGGILVYLYE